MGTVLIVVVLVLLFGGGGSYYAHRNHDGAGPGGVLGTVSIVLLVFWLPGGVQAGWPRS
ncbi:MAG: DUF3309 family protein [Acetobacteraceae bacterium]|nr:DUF3309 family protein [Acetobacteraceae bacterium]